MSRINHIDNFFNDLIIDFHINDNITTQEPFDFKTLTWLECLYIKNNFLKTLIVMIMKSKKNNELNKIYKMMKEHLYLKSSTSNITKKPPQIFQDIISNEQIFISDIRNFNNINICNDRKCNLKNIKYNEETKSNHVGGSASGPRTSKRVGSSPIDILIQMLQKPINHRDKQIILDSSRAILMYFKGSFKEDISKDIELYNNINIIVKIVILMKIIQDIEGEKSGKSPEEQTILEMGIQEFQVRIYDLYKSSKLKGEGGNPSIVEIKKELDEYISSIMINPMNYPQYKFLSLEQANFSEPNNPGLYSVVTNTPLERINYKPLSMESGRTLNITFTFDNYSIGLPLTFEGDKKIEYYTESIEVMRKYMQTLYEFSIEKFNSMTVGLGENTEIRVFDCENIKLQKVQDINKRNTLMKSIFLDCPPGNKYNICVIKGTSLSSIWKESFCATSLGRGGKGIITSTNPNELINVYTRIKVSAETFNHGRNYLEIYKHNTHNTFIFLLNNTTLAGEFDDYLGYILSQFVTKSRISNPPTVKTIVGATFKGKNPNDKIMGNIYKWARGARDENGLIESSEQQEGYVTTAEQLAESYYHKWKPFVNSKLKIYPGEKKVIIKFGSPIFQALLENNLKLLKLKLEIYGETKDENLKKKLILLIPSLIGNFTISNDKITLYAITTLENFCKQILSLDGIKLDDSSLILNLLVDIFKLIYDLLSSPPPTKDRDITKLQKEYKTINDILSIKVSKKCPILSGALAGKGEQSKNKKYLIGYIVKELNTPNLDVQVAVEEGVVEEGDVEVDEEEQAARTESDSAQASLSVKGEAVIHASEQKGIDSSITINEDIGELGKTIQFEYQSLIDDLKKNNFNSAAERFEKINGNFDRLEKYRDFENRENVLLSLNKMKAYIEEIIQESQNVQSSDAVAAVPPFVAAQVAYPAGINQDRIFYLNSELQKINYHIGMIEQRNFFLNTSIQNLNTQLYRLPNTHEQINAINQEIQVMTDELYSIQNSFQYYTGLRQSIIFELPQYPNDPTPGIINGIQGGQYFPQQFPQHQQYFPQQFQHQGGGGKSMQVGGASEQNMKEQQKMEDEIIYMTNLLKFKYYESSDNKLPKLNCFDQIKYIQLKNYEKIYKLYNKVFNK